MSQPDTDPIAPDAAETATALSSSNLASPYPGNPRGDRWCKARMADFLRELGATHSVAAAAKAVGMSRQSAYALRARLKGEPFDIAWEAAFQHGYDALHQAALERALHGVEVPVFHQGQQIGTRREYDSSLTRFLLSARNHKGAQQLGRYRAAADFWSERWDMLLSEVEHGTARWSPAADPSLDETTRAAAQQNIDQEAADQSDRYTAPDPLPRGRGL